MFVYVCSISYWERLLLVKLITHRCRTNITAQCVSILPLNVGLFMINFALMFVMLFHYVWRHRIWPVLREGVI